MPRRAAPAVLPAGAFRLAADSHGLLTTRQLALLDTDRNELRRLVRAGLLHPVHRGVWSVVAELDLAGRVTAAGLALGGGVACLRTAAELLRLDGAPADEQIHVSLPPSRTRHQLQGVTRHWLHLKPDDTTAVRGVPVTTPERLVLDSARRWGRAATVALADSALRNHVVTPGSLADLRERLPLPARGWLDLTDGRAESPLETRMRLLLVDAGLAGLFEAQWTVGSDGRVVGRIDFACPRLRLGLECDGRGPHELPEALFRDRRRADDLAALGWRLIRVTWSDVVDAPELVVARIRRALGVAA